MSGGIWTGVRILAEDPLDGLDLVLAGVADIRNPGFVLDPLLMSLAALLVLADAEEVANHDGSEALLDTPPDGVVGERVEVVGVASRRFRFDFRKTSFENHATAE